MASQSSTPPQNTKNDKPKFSSSDNILSYFKDNLRETVSYILLIVGILLLLYYPLSFYGGIIVGVVAGIFFGDTVVDFIKKWKSDVQSGSQYQVIARNVIALGVALAFLISAPAIFLGAAISIGIKQLFIGQGTIR